MTTNPTVGSIFSSEEYGRIRVVDVNAGSVRWEADNGERGMTTHADWTSSVKEGRVRETTERDPINSLGVVFIGSRKITQRARVRLLDGGYLELCVEADGRATLRASDGQIVLRPSSTNTLAITVEPFGFPACKTCELPFASKVKPPKGGA